MKKLNVNNTPPVYTFLFGTRTKRKELKTNNEYDNLGAGISFFSQNNTLLQKMRC